ncbi:MAG: RraA family protein [Gammaproteobacteria bacterium]|nr:RraA family protein [Gammaproteobacteria bacterium]
MDFADLKQRLARIETTHLADTNKAIRSCDAGIRPLSLGRKLIGRARTVSCHEDFMAVIVALAESEPGEVLVVDTRGSRKAVAGELFSIEAARRGLAGLVVDGPVRDTITIRTLDFPVYARGSNPVAGTVGQLGATQVPVTIGGVVVHPGDILFGDDDGLLVSTLAELEALLPAAEAIEARERAAIARMQAGESLLGMINYEEHRDALAAGRPSALKFLI